MDGITIKIEKDGKKSERFISMMDFESSEAENLVRKLIMVTFREAMRNLE